MRFELKSPCKECPFRSDVEPYLGPERAYGICRDLTKGEKTFACHKTTGVGGGRRILRIDHQMCAGAEIMLEKMGAVHALLQIAERFGLRGPRRLNLAAPVYAHAHAMVRAYQRHVAKRLGNLLSSSQREVKHG